MIIVDTHAHLNFDAFPDADEIVRNCLGRDIWTVNVGCDQETSHKAVLLAEKYRKGVFASVGLHPNNISEEKFDKAYYESLVVGRNKKVVAVGETGLDYFRSDNKALQKEIFIEHIKLSLAFNKPLIVHCRDAHKEALEILKKFKGARGTIHSFTGSAEDALEYLSLGFKISFNGIITFARNYDNIILDTPITDILIETDCPYLTPEPYRGKRNEPQYVLEVAKKLVEIKNLSLETVIKQTTENARNLFGI